MTLTGNQKKSIEKKCSSFKGESKSKCIANAKRQYKERKAKTKQHGKNIDKLYSAEDKEDAQIKKDTKKHGKSVAEALYTIRFKQSKAGKKWASKGREKRRDVKKQKFPYSR